VPAEFAPIAVFAFRRPDHLRRCLAALSAATGARESQLIVFCDGPRDESDRALVERTREVARAASGFASVEVVEAQRNKGLAASVIEGVTHVLADHENVIVVEDDLVVSEDFLAFMNQGLFLYRDDERVVSIHGFLPAVEASMPQSFFLRGADCWGWATWRESWQSVNFDGAELLDQLRKHPDRSQFDFGGAYPYLKMLQDQVDGAIDSWAIRWYASAFLTDRYTLHPGVSLVTNIGMEGSGTHLGDVDALRSSAGRLALPLREIPVADNTAARHAIARAFEGKSGPQRWMQRIMRGLRMAR